MKYIYKSLEFSQQNLGLLALFIIINLIPILLSTFLQTENNVNILYSIFSILVYMSSFFLISGTLSIIWKRFKNVPINFSLLITESKLYFCSFFGVNLAILIFGLIVAILFSLLYEHQFHKSIESVDFYSTSEFATIISVSFYLILAIYCYAIPYLYLKKLNSKRAIISAPKILLKYKNQSAPIFILLFINLLITSLYPENPIESWQRAALISAINIYIYFHLYLVSCQILDELDISNI